VAAVLTTLVDINLEKLRALVMREPLAIAGRQLGDAGSIRMKAILRFLKRSSRYATVHDDTELTVFALMRPDPVVESLRVQHATPFQFGVTALGSVDHLIVEIREDESPFVWLDAPAEVGTAMQRGIVYRLAQRVETFSVNGVCIAVPKVIEDAVSQFLLNCFSDLREALLAYRDSMARTSKCHLLRQAWVDEERLWFDVGPEYRLRRSLHNYLYSYLRHDDIDLREEQNVDDSHPVDIKIVWRMENRTAIIEVKWIGKSIDRATRRITASYAGARARQGAKQLAEYLEAHRQEAPKEDTRGYLVVFDCRRKGLTAAATSVTRANGFYYHAREIAYRPKFHKRRKDFEEPIRMFLEPVCL
jgi:hypothetical protein